MPSPFTWPQAPFIRLIIPLIVGIILANWFDQSLPQLLFIFAIIWIGICILGNQRMLKRSVLYGVLLNIALLFFGYQLCWLNNELRHPNHFSTQEIEQQATIIGRIADMPIGKEKRVKVLLKVQAIGEKDTLQEANGNLLVYLARDEKSVDLSYGDVISIRAYANEIDAPSNPEAFDYKSYLHHQNIHHQSFVKAENWQLLAENQGFFIFSVAYKLRTKCLNILRKYLPDEQTFSVGAALILGYKDEMSDDVQAAYAQTGAMHVLAVSGLHVGLIFIIVTFLMSKFQPLEYFKHRKKKAAILLLSIWGFALLTGASPSVVRAAVMFSVIIVGKAIRRRSYIYNNIGISAFLILLYNPYLLFNVGFQLSYAAVLGIVYFQHKIFVLWVSQHAALRWIWRLTSVSIAAQLATLPFSLYYFHQFPTYFWLSSLVVIPAASVILSGGLLLFILETISTTLGWLLGTALYWFIWFVNLLIFQIQHLPGGLITGIFISSLSVILLYLVISGVMRGINRREFKWWIYSSVLLLAIIFSYSFSQYQNYNNRKIVIYDVYKNSLLDFVDGTTTYTLKSADLSEKNEAFAAQNYRWKLGINDVQKQAISDSIAIEKGNFYYENNCVQFHSKRLAFIHQPIANSAKRLRVDYLVFTNNPRVNVERIVENFQFKQAIFDASNSDWRIKKWRLACDSLNISYYDITEQGAFILDL